MLDYKCKHKKLKNRVIRGQYGESFRKHGRGIKEGVAVKWL
jgi:hypothetical protein